MTTHAPPADSVASEKAHDRSQEFSYRMTIVHCDTASFLCGSDLFSRAEDATRSFQYCSVAKDLLTGRLHDPSAADHDERKPRLSPPILG